MPKDDKLDAKDRLLAAGLKIFAEKGYNGSTFRDICDEAGSNIAAINYYFNDKEGFYCAVRDFARNKHRAMMEKCWAVVDSDPWLALRIHVEILLDQTYDDSMFRANWFRMRELIDAGNFPELASTPEVEASRKKYNDRMTKLMTTLLGDAATPQNISLLHYTYHSLCLFMPIHRQIEARRHSKEPWQFNIISTVDKKDFTEFILNAVKRTVESMRQTLSSSAEDITSNDSDK